MSVKRGENNVEGTEDRTISFEHSKSYSFVAQQYSSWKENFPGI